MMNINLNAIKKVHFIGVGGIGVSAIAKMMLTNGREVSGSDLKQSEITNELKSSGAEVFIGHKMENVTEDSDLVIYSPAVPEDNPELAQARQLGVSVLSYPEVLGIISKEKYTIAVSGTHGKTTTTGMIAKIFIDAGKDPTVIIGSILKDSGSNFVAGKGKYFVVEACEYKRSFLNINPKILVITNIDNDHLDYYKDIEDIQSAFRELAIKVSQDGFIVCDANNERIKPVLSGIKAKIIDYSQLGSLASKLGLKVPGEHNRKNAAAALAVASAAGLDLGRAKKSLENFSGTWRRFEYKDKTKNGVLVYDDYAHHPTEIKATLSGAREIFPDKKITVVFQPHLYSRTKLLLDDFAESLSKADRVILAPIYAAREKDESISSKDLASKISKINKNVLYITEFEKIADELKNSGANNLIITMGAGDIYKVGEKLLK